jgi:hypothetical protein
MLAHAQGQFELKSQSLSEANAQAVEEGLLA